MCCLCCAPCQLLYSVSDHAPQMQVALHNSFSRDLAQFIMNLQILPIAMIVSVDAACFWHAGGTNFQRSKESSTNLQTRLDKQVAQRLSTSFQSFT